MPISLEDFSSINHLIDERDAAKALCCSVAALRKWWLLGRGPAYCKVGRLVRYAEGDLHAYLDANRVDPLAAGGARKYMPRAEGQTNDRVSRKPVFCPRRQRGMPLDALNDGPGVHAYVALNSVGN